jgi:hypothetical protein
VDAFVAINIAGILIWNGKSFVQFQLKASINSQTPSGLENPALFGNARRMGLRQEGKTC